MEAPVPAQAVHQQRSRGDRRSYPPRTLQNQTGEAESSSPATTFRPHQQNYQQRRASGRGGPVRPAPTAPLAHSQLQATSAVEANTAGDTRLRASFTGVGRGRGRGEPRRGSAGRGRSLRQAHQQSHITGGAFQGRQFGGHLSSNDTSDIVQASSSPALQADAPDFVPGQAHATKTRTAGQQTPGKQRRYSKSMAPDIATRTHEDIEHGVNGPQMKDLRSRNSRHNRILLRRGNGDVLVAIYQKTPSQKHTIAGVKRRWSLGLLPDYLLIRVVKRAEERAQYLRIAHIHAT
ncbi:MAG: FKBP12-associated protein [Bogoriella megaspora]|nr:MAG: FKBP12-associated protein [Bogoriella megaspora]